MPIRRKTRCTCFTNVIGSPIKSLPNHARHIYENVYIIIHDRGKKSSTQQPQTSSSIKIFPLIKTVLAVLLILAGGIIPTVKWQIGVLSSLVLKFSSVPSNLSTETLKSTTILRCKEIHFVWSCLFNVSDIVAKDDSLSPTHFLI